MQATESVSGALGGETGGTEWEFYATGHSLGGFLAAAVTIELDPDISKCARAPMRCNAGTRMTRFLIYHS